MCSAQCFSSSPDHSMSFHGCIDYCSFATAGWAEKFYERAFSVLQQGVALKKTSSLLVMALFIKEWLLFWAYDRTMNPSCLPLVYILIVAVQVFSHQFHVTTQLEEGSELLCYLLLWLNLFFKQIMLIQAFSFTECQSVVHTHKMSLWPECTNFHQQLFAPLVQLHGDRRENDTIPCETLKQHVT